MEDFRKKVHGAFAEYLREVIYGGIDGIITTFAVVAGFAGAALTSDTTTQLSFLVVLLFGLANLFADAASMGLGNFLSVRSDKDVYQVLREKERDKLQSDPENEKAETLRILQNKGFSNEDSTNLAGLYRNNEEYWLDFMMHHKRELSDPRGENEFITGLITFISFMIFGAIPLLPFMFDENGGAADAFTYSCIGTFIALIILGLLKWKVIGTKLNASLFEVVAIGVTAASLAYFVGTFFSAL